MRDGEHDAIFRAFERHRIMLRPGFVEDIVACAVLAFVVAVAALKNKNFFDAVVSVRGITAAGLHAYQDCPVSCLLVASEDMEKNSLVSRPAPRY